MFDCLFVILMASRIYRHFLYLYLILVGSVWFLCFNGISTFVGYLMPKQFFEKNRKLYYLTHSWEDKGVHTFPTGIWPKMDFIARLEFELAFYDFAVHRFHHYTTILQLVKSLEILFLFRSFLLRLQSNSRKNKPLYQATSRLILCLFSFRAVSVRYRYTLLLGISALWKVKKKDLPVFGLEYLSRL